MVVQMFLALPFLWRKRCQPLSIASKCQTMWISRDGRIFWWPVCSRDSTHGAFAPYGPGPDGSRSTCRPGVATHGQVALSDLPACLCCGRCLTRGCPAPQCMPGATVPPAGPPATFLRELKRNATVPCPYGRGKPMPCRAQKPSLCPAESFHGLRVIIGSVFWREKRY